MRRIRIEYESTRGRLKRGGGQKPGPITDEPSVCDQDPVKALAVGAAFEELEQDETRDYCGDSVSVTVSDSGTPCMVTVNRKT